MSKKKCPECPAGEKWAVPYADFLSLLLALFIALWAISSTESSKAKALSQAIITIFSNPPKSSVFQPIFQRPPDPGEVREETEGKQPQTADGQAAVSIKHDNLKQIETLVQEGGVLEQVEQGIILRLPSDLLFEEGRADLNNEEMITYVRRIAEIIKKLPPDVKIDVRGYTDDKPLPSSSVYSDLYELASARSHAVMSQLLANGVKPERISYSSYGPYSPVAPNTTIENRAKNNRVEIFLSSSPNSAKTIKSVLDGGASQNAQEGGTGVEGGANVSGAGGGGNAGASAPK